MLGALCQVIPSGDHQAQEGRHRRKRGKLFAKLIKNIEIAARLGGGDPDGNPSLYDAIYKAKKASMPADNIARAVKRGAGAEDGAANYEDIVYEATLLPALASSSNA